MDHPRPEVTIYMATRNRARQVRRAIASVLAQTFADFEFIIVDDASIDETSSVLEEAVRRDQRIRVISRHASGGASAARNMAIRSARGRFLVGIDDDDAMLPDRIEILLRGHSNDRSFVCTPYYQEYASSIRPGPIGPSEIHLTDLLERDAVGIQVLALTSRVIEAGLFDEAMPAWVDYDLFTRLVILFGPGKRIPIRTAVVNVDPKGTRVTTSRRALAGAKIYYSKYVHLMNDAQRRCQWLMQSTIQDGRLKFADARRCWGPGTRIRVVRAFIATNASLLRHVRDTYWRLRWPASRFEWPFPLESTPDTKAQLG